MIRVDRTVVCSQKVIKGRSMVSCCIDVLERITRLVQVLIGLVRHESDEHTHRFQLVVSHCVLVSSLISQRHVAPVTESAHGCVTRSALDIKRYKHDATGLQNMLQST